MAHPQAPLIVSLPSGEGLEEAVGGIADVEFVAWDLEGPPPRERIDVVVPPYWGGARRLAELAGVETRLVQWQSIGYDGVAEALPSGVQLANAATVHETSTAELALALALAAQRGIPGFVRDGDQRRWQLRSFPSLADRRVLLVGYGGVGKAIEARLTGFEARLTRLARTARTDRNLAGEEVEIRGLDRLHAALAEAEVAILAVPLTDDTRGLMDAAALAALPDGALLVNVARGPVVDTDALVSELNAGRLRAALDVTEPEPLPAGHPLWNCPNLLITPHVGGDSSAMLPRMAALIRRQIGHLRAGEAPENLVLGG
ncbi:hydroxyacid dehydrogenase [Leucobacter weissii]|uniref:Hydroxyacid dehydrogenase n=1 Tax=Leucobacter weissii TaxID=1983706 RepID=A0A939SCS8_9MICO|nr:NAD(P)-dependent oxidoreductase [Leucobacter weissii]MBO1902668.1 hydroxyacid dehydrogenase [Leucobacter weissii]